jgi:hypothetical protein
VSTDTIPIVGVSLGHRHLKTAISVIERAYVRTSPGEVFTVVRYDGPSYRPARFETHEPVILEYRVRHLERHGPPTRYTKIAQRIPEVLKEATTKIGVPHADLILDITAGGHPVYARIYQEVRRSLEDTRISITYGPVTVTGVAGGVSKSPDVGWLVPRRDLISTAQILLDEGQLKIAEGLELAQTLKTEMIEFKPKPNQKPDDLEGWREGKDDDLVLAVAVSLWAVERFRRKEESRPADSPILNPALRP